MFYRKNANNEYDIRILNSRVPLHVFAVDIFCFVIAKYHVMS